MGRRLVKTGGILIVAAVAAACVYLVLSCWWHNREREEITDSVRQAASGSFAHLSDGFTHYEIAGLGSRRTVVLIHGFSVPYYLWDKTFDPLGKAGFCVLRYDLYGRGLSDRPHEHYNADLYDRQLSELLTSLRVQTPVDLVAASMGGSIAVTFAARHPEKVRTLSLFDPDYRVGSLVVWPIQAPLLGECLACGYIVPSLPDGQRRDFMHPERSPDYFQRYLEQMRFKGFRRAILSTIRDYYTVDVRPDYRSIGKSHIPVFLLWGRLDRAVPFALSKQVLQDIPQSEFHALEGVAHVGFHENPEVVNSMLIEFLNKN